MLDRDVRFVPKAETVRRLPALISELIWINSENLVLTYHLSPAYWRKDYVPAPGIKQRIWVLP